jgi:outer membrane protein assembly factor BamD (BamD/ComL family)
MISPLLNVEALPVREELLGMARHLQTAGRGSTALRLLEEYRRRYPLEPGMDEALYRMGELYESDSGLRDLAAARSAYRRVYEQWPESRFAERAYERLQYLERHFFDVR